MTVFLVAFAVAAGSAFAAAGCLAGFSVFPGFTGLAFGASLTSLGSFSAAGPAVRAAGVFEAAVRFLGAAGRASVLRGSAAFLSVAFFVAEAVFFSATPPVFSGFTLAVVPFTGLFFAGSGLADAFLAGGAVLAGFSACTAFPVLALAGFSATFAVRDCFPSSATFFFTFFVSFADVFSTPAALGFFAVREADSLAFFAVFFTFSASAAAIFFFLFVSFLVVAIELCNLPS
ncbi:MAG: hypothetical protein I3I94_06655 [Acidaminococcaceae bacterium]|nr:hypothetical protein [Acidaminococcaceae bacterium]